MTEKLIRHRIPAIVAAGGEVLRTRVATKEEMPDLLRQKLREEMEELIAAPPSKVTEEAGDVIEVVFSYCRIMGFTAEGTARAAMEKLMKKGTFDSGVVLITESDA